MGRRHPTSRQQDGGCLISGVFGPVAPCVVQWSHNKVEQLVTMTLHFDNWRHSRAFRIGRQAHHEKMRRAASARRQRLVALVASGRYRPNTNQPLADALGVHRATLHKDLVALKDSGRCLHCGQPLPAMVP